MSCWIGDLSFVTAASVASRESVSMALTWLMGPSSLPSIDACGSALRKSLHLIPSSALCPLEARGKRGDDHSQSTVLLAFSGGLPEQSETFWNLVGRNEQTWEVHGI
jgi:hypothetical protein